MKAKTRAYAGLAGLISGLMLIGTTGLTFVLGWTLWAVGLGVLLAAVPSADDDRGHREPAPSQYSLVR